MGLRDFANKGFENKQNVLLVRYKAAKVILIFAALIFFLNFYLLGANFAFPVLMNFLSFTYFFLLLTFLYYFYLLFQLKVSSRPFVKGVVFFLLLCITGVLMFPIIFKSGFGHFIQYIAFFSLL